MTIAELRELLAIHSRIVETSRSQSRSQMRETNVALIVAMHAALPALLDVAEAARQVHADAHPYSSNEGCPLCDALARLEKST